MHSANHLNKLHDKLKQINESFNKVELYGMRIVNLFILWFNID